MSTPTSPGPSSPVQVRSGFETAARPTVAARLSGGLAGRMASADSAMGLVGSLLLPLGLLLVLLGWYGAAHTPFLFEQVPYLISGGLLGLGLLLVGGMALFGSWVARTAGEQRAANAEVLAALREIRDELAGAAGAAAAPPRQRGGRAAANGHAGSPDRLVATANGSMLHRPDCAVVVSREDVHAVTTRERQGLQPCRLCDPLGAPATA